MEEKLYQVKKKYLICLISVAILCVTTGFVLGYKAKPAEVLASRAIRENNSQYTFIHPLLAVGRADTKKPTSGYINLSKKVQTFIENQIADSNIDRASVYFINYGDKSGSFSLNEDELFAPASLLKVVIMVGYLKKSDEDSSILNRKLTYNTSVAHNLETIPFQTPTKLKIGSAYSVATLIDKMIIDSDNGAMELLLENIDDAYLTKVYTDLGLRGPEVDSTYRISTKDYSLFFRILYNATYLSKTSSEKALSILSKTIFSDGISKNIPEDTVIAHKFGQHINGEGDHVDSIELHDCGMVYITDGPYLLCVMTKGEDVSYLSDTISAISKIIYEDVISK